MNIGVILAAGESTRFEGNKLFAELNGRAVVEYAVDLFKNNGNIAETILVVNEKDLPRAQKLGVKVIAGGNSRQDSLKRAFEAIPKCENVVIHNGANPLATEEELNLVIQLLNKEKAVSVAREIHATVKEIKDNYVVKTLPRENLRATETPQGIKYEVLAAALKENMEVTDDVALAETLGIKPFLVPASPYNFKITTATDLEICRKLVEAPTGYLVGLGEDSHKFSAEKGLNLAGVNFPQYRKLQADSDGDVILHAIVTAILQALGEGSLDKFTGPLFAQGITDSKEYLKKVLAKLGDYEINNISIMIEAKEPAIDPLVPHLTKSLERLLGGNISIAAHSGEELTSFGKGEGMRCLAVVSLIKK